MNNQAAKTMPECTCRDNEGCTKPCDRKAFQAVPLSEELLIEAAILSGNTPQERRLQKVLKQAAAALTQNAGVPSWIVNDLGELGVMVNGVAYFLYKGDNIVYEDAKHDDGSPMLYRMVGKREFGEVCRPRHWEENGWAAAHRYTQELVYTPGLSFGKPEDGNWRPLPTQAAAPAASGGEVWTREMIADVHKRGEELFQRINPPAAASVSERARELLAAEYDKIGLNGAATYIRSGQHGELDKAIIRAIEQALTQQQATTPQPSSDAVRELVERWRSNGHPYVSDCADELESLLSAASGEKGVG